MEEEKKREKKAEWIAPLFLITVFLVSFSASAYIYINSRNLIFEPELQKIEELAKIIGKKENEITELKAELERYKTLYDAAIKNSETVFSHSEDSLYENNN